MATARRTGTNENVSTYGGVGLGRDYTALATWEAATDNDLVTAMTSEVLECYDDEVFDDRLEIMSGATTNTSFFRIIRPAPGQEHDGTINTGVRFQATGTGQYFLRIGEDNSSVQDLVAKYTRNTTTSPTGCIRLEKDNTSCVGCIAHNITNSDASNGEGFRFEEAGATGYFADCIAHDCIEFGFVATIGTGYAYNCTSIGNATGFRVFATFIAKNCLADGNSTDFDGTFDASSDFNASSDATAPGGSSRTSQTFTFQDPASNNYHLRVTDTGALGFGTDLSADANFPFDDDIDGDVISTWSIGADSDPVNTAGATGIAFGRRRRRRHHTL